MVEKFSNDAMEVLLNYDYPGNVRELENIIEYGFVLCSDECYTELYFGERPRSVLEYGRAGCLAFHSLSKRSGMTGIAMSPRIGSPVWRR